MKEVDLKEAVAILQQKEFTADKLRAMQRFLVEPGEASFTIMDQHGDYLVNESLDYRENPMAKGLIDSVQSYLLNSLIECDTQLKQLGVDIEELPVDEPDVPAAAPQAETEVLF